MNLFNSECYLWMTFISLWMYQWYKTKAVYDLWITFWRKTKLPLQMLQLLNYKSCIQLSYKQANSDLHIREKQSLWDSPLLFIAIILPSDIAWWSSIAVDIDKTIEKMYHEYVYFFNEMIVPVRAYVPKHIHLKLH
jgi:hypothetical protein